MKVFIVYAHHEPKSFNAAMKDTAVSVLTEAEHEIKVSDLYAMNFKAVADGRDFLERANPDYLKYQEEQKQAYKSGKLAPDIVAEQEKLLWCDYLIMLFPMWYFSMPAIMKGWVDRVLTAGFAYGDGKWYDDGGLKGRKAMIAVTTGSPDDWFGVDRINPEIKEILFHINFGVLYFVGFDMLEPFVAWQPSHVSQKKREGYLEKYKERLLTMETARTISYPMLSEYDENLQLITDEDYGDM